MEKWTILIDTLQFTEQTNKQKIQASLFTNKTAFYTEIKPNQKVKKLKLKCLYLNSMVLFLQTDKNSFRKCRYNNYNKGELQSYSWSIFRLFLVIFLNWKFDFGTQLLRNRSTELKLKFFIISTVSEVTTVPSRVYWTW